MKTTDSIVLSNIGNVTKMPDPIEAIKEQALTAAFVLAKEMGVKDVRAYLQVMLNERSNEGIKKYKTTLSNANLPREVLLRHALEECLDLANYIEAILQIK